MLSLWEMGWSGEGLVGNITFAAGVVILIVIGSPITFLRANIYWLFTIYQVTFQWLCLYYYYMCYFTSTRKVLFWCPFSDEKNRGTATTLPRPLHQGNSRAGAGLFVLYIKHIFFFNFYHSNMQVKFSIRYLRTSSSIWK